MRDAILYFRPIPARRLGDVQSLAAFLDRLVADIEGRGNFCDRLSPDSKQQLIGFDLELSLP
jgi:hypothetical protein